MPISMDHYTGEWLYYNSAAGSYHTKTLCSRLYSIEMNLKKNKKSLSEPTFGALRGNVCTPLLESPWLTFCSSQLNIFCYLLRLRRQKWKSVKVGVFRRGWVTECKFQMEGASPINHYWCQKTRVIALSCGIKISAVHCLFLSQSTHVIDRQMHGQNYNSQDHAAVAASCSKNWVATESFRISCDLPTFC